MNNKQQIIKYKVGEDKNNIDNFAYNNKYYFYINKNDKFIQDTLKQGYLFEKNNIISAYQYVRTGSIVLDIGANIGTFGIPMCNSAFGDVTVISFEPQDKIYRLLKCNREINNANNLAIVKLAVGNRNKDIYLNPQITVPGNNKKNRVTTNINKYSGSVQLGTRGEKIKMITLDYFVDRLELRDISVIKIDVEGGEPFVFMGAMRTIERELPVILFEYNYQKLDDDVVKSLQLSNCERNFNIFLFLRNLGYSRIVELPPLKENLLVLHSSSKEQIDDPDYKIEFDRYNNKTRFKYYRYVKRQL